MEPDEFEGGKIEDSIHIPVGLIRKTKNNWRISEVKKFVPTVEQDIEAT